MLIIISKSIFYNNENQKCIENKYVIWNHHIWNIKCIILYFNTYTDGNRISFVNLFPLLFDYQVQMNLMLKHFWSFFYLRNDLLLMTFQCARKLYMFFDLRVYLGSWWRKRFNNLQNTFDHRQTVLHAELGKNNLVVIF